MTYNVFSGTLNPTQSINQSTWPTNGWDRFGSLGHPSKFQRLSRLGFVTAATSLTGGQSNFAWCLAVSWAAILSGALAPWRNIARCKFTLHPSLAFSYIGSVTAYRNRNCTALQPRASAKLCGVVQGMELRNFRRGRHLYSAGRPSRLASAYILVKFCIGPVQSCDGTARTLRTVTSW